MPGIPFGAIDKVKASLKNLFKKKTDSKTQAAKPADTTENKTEAAKPAEPVPATTTTATAGATETKPEAPAPASKPTFFA
ncbi:hypothetical protein VCV18_008591 [Metarhizium anisopliae]